MSQTITIAIFLSLALGFHIPGKLFSQKTGLHELGDSLILDKDGNRYTTKLLSDSHLWMTANLNLNIRDSYCYNNASKNCEQYGRLYTWESARLACKLLGDGWRLPSDSDWHQLTILYGGNSVDSELVRRQAYKSLLNSGKSGFNAVLGGGRSPDGEYARLNAHGFYWTSTETDKGEALFYNFGKGSQGLYRQDAGEKARAFSVRCIKKPE